MKKLIPIILFLLVCTVDSYAQFNNPNDHFLNGMRAEASRREYNRRKAAGEDVSAWWRPSSGVCLPMATATYVEDIVVKDPNDASITLSHISHVKKLTAMNAWGAVGGTFYRIADMGENGILALNTEVNMSFLEWTTDKLDAGGGNYYQYDFTTMATSLPISVDMKWGGEAILDKSQLASFTLGLGFAPTLNTTVISSKQESALNQVNGYLKGQVLPFIKAELGIHAGIFFKLRGTCTFGKIKYFTYDDRYPDGSGETLSLIGKSQFSVALLINPMGAEWNDVSWWKHKHSHHRHS